MQSRHFIPALLILSGLVSACLDVDALRSELKSRRESALLTDVWPDQQSDDAQSVDDLNLDLQLPDLDVETSQPFELAAVLPAKGDASGGELVLLAGAGFHDDMEVYFGEQKGGALFVVDSRYATVQTPAHAAGAVDVTLVGLGAQKSVLAGGFTYVARLAVIAIEPDGGPGTGGEPIWVEGTGFSQDCQLFLGGRLATGLLLIDDNHLGAVSPPGACGPTDVRLRCGDEMALLEDGYHYKRNPEALSLQPSYGPAAGGTAVQLRGRGFRPDMKILVGGAPVSGFTFLAEGLVRFKTPPGAAGTAVLSMETECGASELEAGFLYHAPAPPGTQVPRILDLSPKSLPACTGGELRLAAEIPGSPSWIQVLVGDQSCDILEVHAEEGLIVVKAPSAPPGTVGVKLLVPQGGSVLPDAFEYTAGLVITAVEPSRGYKGGGTPLELKGCGFPLEGEVRFGTSVATDVSFLSSKSIRLSTPPGSPGPVDVTVVGLSEIGTRPGGFEYTELEPTLYFLDPPSGARSGGTWVRAYGAGLPSDALWRFDEEEAINPVDVDSSMVVMRAPAHAVGEATVSAETDSASVEKPQAYSYFDPYAKKGGTSGGPLDESLNVTVRDSSTGTGLLGALVVVGKAPDSRMSGYADANGQITFSLPGFQGKQDITAAHPGYNLYSVVHFDATNVTVFLSPQSIGSSGSTSTYVAPVSYVSGRVYGAEKYLVTPLGPCVMEAATAPQCQSCGSDEDCPSADGLATFHCTHAGNLGQVCTRDCQSSEECPLTMVCAHVEAERNACIPRMLEPVTKCTTSKSSMFGLSPDPGIGGTVNAHDIYFAKTRIGEVAVVCYGGYMAPTTGQFEPTVMGVRRNIIAYPDEVTQDVDVTLNIPLQREGRVAFFDLPVHPNGLRMPYILSSIELGSDGYLDPPVKGTWVASGGYFSFPRLPARFDGPLTGATFSFYASVQSMTDNAIPYAVRMVSDVDSLFSGGLVRFDGDSAVPLFPPADGDIVGLAAGPGGTLAVATSQGALFLQQGAFWTPVPIATDGERFTSLHQGADPDIWVGGERGSVWHFDGTAWTQSHAGFTGSIVDLWARGDSVVLLVATAVVVLNGDTVQKVTPLPPGRMGRAIWGADLDELWVVTDGHAVWKLSGDGWVQKVSDPGLDFTDVSGFGPDEIWISAEPGALLKHDGDAYEIVEFDDCTGLRSVHVAAPAQVAAAGDDGMLVAWDADHFVRLESGTQADLSSLVFQPEAGLLAAGGVQAYHMGPFMAYPHISSPAPYQSFDFTTLVWDFWTPGAMADFHYLILSNSEGYPFWTMVVDGDVNSVELPPLASILGVNVIPEGIKRLNLTSSLNPVFDIDQFTNNDLSIYDKTSWSVDMVTFQ